MGNAQSGETPNTLFPANKGNAIGVHDKANNGNEYNQTGYHVLQVQPNSPACGRLVPFFDFIVAANQVIFDKEDSRFADTFRENVGKEVQLIVYNIKSDTTREQVIVPSNSWGGNGLAGISIRFCSWVKTLETVWHILDVYMNSPAHESGLQTRTDYIVGTPDLILNEQEDFFTLINNNMYRPIQLYVYSSLTEQVRLVTITPNKNWGGSGSLGCDIGYGLLHRIPTKQSVTTQMISPSMDQLKSMLPASSSSSSSQSPPSNLNNNNNNNINNDNNNNNGLTPNRPSGGGMDDGLIETTEPIKLDLTQLDIHGNNDPSAQQTQQQHNIDQSKQQQVAPTSSSTSFQHISLE
ncbi:hypothetical protein SAMD00019534_032800 [Acytostelium subglobosum LB1]|uniref:hypothetical protein n=1 Tax=Acytostelium subglobosum LB1 TaxID=1410327 RepID=UPI000644AC77|nr:hypothetical protein SAMD00019534_032800 [Acytostelium subglobosum LB1]GAM20105.1 hypothetical protein SAMD00019534_032800 [Acytostelium subglobosum LB1]|eukprot:XP_012756867.1 hypothetical protein SAMD00019534_032800 [Acytostelium subglobosum LB1]